MSRRGTARLLALALAAAILTASGPATANTTAGAHATKQRTSLTAIWNEVMCPTCHEPLSVAQSPQAVDERRYIQRLVVAGETKAQIERALVSELGPGVLGRPPAHGFNLLVYILPPALLVAGIAFLAFSLPRWRDRARAAAAEPMGAAARTPSGEESRRLDEDLARFG